MKKILFYCQNLLGMGHLVRTTELIHALTQTFQVCLVDGGQPVAGFEVPSGIEVVQLPTLQVQVSDAAVGRELQVVGSSMSLEIVKQHRKAILIRTFDEFQPDCVITEGYPFSKNKALAFEMEPFLAHVRAITRPVKVLCSLRDIIMVKEFTDRDFEEQRRCEFANQFYDGILVHSDPAIHRLENNISCVHTLTIPIYYTGYVVQSEPKGVGMSDEDKELLHDSQPMIVVSVGGGKLGHDLLEAVIQSASLLKEKIPHRLVIFAGPLMDEHQFQHFRSLAQGQSNVILRRFTPNLLAYLNQADLSMSLGGYNTTMNILKTGVRAMIYPSNKDREQAIRAEKLERLELLKILYPEDLAPPRLVQTIVNNLRKTPASQRAHLLQLNGAAESAAIVHSILQSSLVTA
jgi:predicted glycosyltransferase